MLWLLGKILSIRPVRDALIKKAQRRPYLMLPGYMDRWWLCNGYGDDHKRRFEWLPAIRIHHILRADRDEHLHDHPCDARTFILKGWYVEEREAVAGAADAFRYRLEGDTTALPHGTFHSIRQVSEGGVWTLFVLYRRKSSWGFKVNGRKVDYRDYLGLNHREQR